MPTPEIKSTSSSAKVIPEALIKLYRQSLTLYASERPLFIKSRHLSTCCQNNSSSNVPLEYSSAFETNALVRFSNSCSSCSFFGSSVIIKKLKRGTRNEL